MVKRTSKISSYYRQRKRRNTRSIYRRRRGATSRIGLMMRRKRRTRRTRTTKFATSIPKHMRVWTRSDEYTGIISATGTPLLLHYSDLLVSADNTTFNEIQKYVRMYDSFRPRKVLVEMWSDDNDDVTTANLQYPRVQWYNDPHSEGRTMTQQSIAYQEQRKECFLKPMQKVWHSIIPKFRTILYTGASTLQPKYGYEVNYWRDVQDLRNQTIEPFVSSNGIQISLIGASVNSIKYRYHYQWDFKNPITVKAYNT